jgi:secreted PhoX family phosphatase
VRLAGGRGVKDSSKYFSNPDAIATFRGNGKTWLMICEDQLQEPHDCNEVWWLDADIKQPSVDSLYRFLSAPPGTEATGLCLSTDRKTLFLNIQHPARENTPPFHKSCTLAIRSKSWKATYRGGKGVNVSFW